MMYLRWYDKDPAIKEFMAMLESLDPETIDYLAQDFIQLIMNSGFIDVDSTIKLLDSKSTGKYNRWYDKNYNLHTCVELLKNLPEEQQKQILETFKESCYEFITNIYYEQENND